MAIAQLGRLSLIDRPHVHPKAELLSTRLFEERFFDSWDRTIVHLKLRSLFIRESFAGREFLERML
jgi:hypothetical protein